MNIRTALLASACALALSACGGDDASPTADPAATPPATPAETVPAQTPPATTDAAPDTAAPAQTSDAAPPDATAAAGGACEVEIEGNDAMQFNMKTITIPSSCSDFTVTLVHTGKMPVAAMGHNVVITTAEDMQGVAADGMAAGLDAGYVKPDDERVIAATELIGGGETSSVTFSTSDFESGGDYRFFCSFPGHAALMTGTVVVE